MTNETFPDPLVGILAVGVVMAGLRRRRKTGIGGFIDLSQREATVGVLGDALLDYSVTGRVAGPAGNTHPGMAIDLTSQHSVGGNRVVYLVGPHTLGFLAAGWMVVRGRTMVFRRRPLTIGVMTLGCVLIAQVIILVVLVVRSAEWYPGGVIHWTDTTLGIEVLRRTLIAVYSGLFAIPAGWLLVRTIPLWGFQAVSHRTPMMR